MSFYFSYEDGPLGYEVGQTIARTPAVLPGLPVRSAACATRGHLLGTAWTSTRLRLRVRALINRLSALLGAFLAAVTLVVATAGTASSAVADETPAASHVPANVWAPSTLRKLVEVIAARSPTFRHQCARIAARRGLLVVIRVAPPRADRRYAAQTVVRQLRDGGMTAIVDLYLPYNAAETIAHEFEHVIEQIEGVDLRRLSISRRSGVMESGIGIYETRRAVDAGHRVAREFRTARTPAIAVSAKFGRLTARVTGGPHPAAVGGGALGLQGRVLGARTSASPASSIRASSMIRWPREERWAHRVRDARRELAAGLARSDT